MKLTFSTVKNIIRFVLVCLMLSQLIFNHNSYAQQSRHNLPHINNVKYINPLLELESLETNTYSFTNKTKISFSSISTVNQKKFYGTISFPLPTDTINTNYIPWESNAHLGLAISEMALLEFIPWALAKWVRKEDWANVSPNSWWKNISKGWLYDGDTFLTNQFAHPYHGNLFFNAARTNGYSFWESVPFPFIGSMIWEYFGETFRPAINDWINTSFSGINLGEILYRLSNMITDNTASGSERVFREIGGALVNPARGFNRLINGETGRIFPNPVDRVPKTLWQDFFFGARSFKRVKNDTISASVTDAIFEYNLTYGDFLTANLAKPFSVFHLNLAFATANPHLTKVRASGNLFNIFIKRAKYTTHLFMVSLNYNYWNNLGFELGNTQFMFHFLSDFTLKKQTKISVDAALSGIVLGATRTEFFLDPEGRDYDYGPGIGMSLIVSVHSKNWILFQARYVSNWIWTVSGTLNSKHHLHLLGMQGLLPIYKNLAVGLTFAVYWRESYYPIFTDVFVTSPVGRIFLALKI